MLLEKHYQELNDTAEVATSWDQDYQQTNYCTDISHVVQQILGEIEWYLWGGTDIGRKWMIPQRLATFLLLTAANVSFAQLQNSRQQQVLGRLPYRGVADEEKLVRWVAFQARQSGRQDVQTSTRLQPLEGSVSLPDTAIVCDIFPQRRETVHLQQTYQNICRSLNCIAKNGSCIQRAHIPSCLARTLGSCCTGRRNTVHAPRTWRQCLHSTSRTPIRTDRIVGLHKGWCLATFC